MFLEITLSPCHLSTLNSIIYIEFHDGNGNFVARKFADPRKETDAHSLYLSICNFENIDRDNDNAYARKQFSRLVSASKQRGYVSRRFVCEPRKNSNRGYEHLENEERNNGNSLDLWERYSRFHLPD